MAASRKRLRADLAVHLHHFLQARIAPGSHPLLGLSGGLDSRVLLDLLVQVRESCGFRLSAVHVNHRISPNADAWAEFCSNICHAANVTFKTVAIDVPRDSGLGLEAAAREARYRVLLAQGADSLILAHHQDDQAETLLLQLLRGAGVKGLAAMGADSGGREKNILRPFLDVPRSKLLEYAEERGLSWIEDESNLDLAYDRNFLRHHVFPELEKRFPGCRVTFARSAAHFAEAADLLEEVALADAAQYVHNGQLDVGGLRSLSPARAMNLLRWWIAERSGLPLSSARLHSILDQLCHARENAQVECRLGDAVLRRYRDTAYIEPGCLAQPYRVEWHGESSLGLPDGSRLDFRRMTGQGIALARLKESLFIGNRQGGARLRPDCRRPTRSLKNLWQEAGIPPAERERTPLIWHGSELVAVPGLGVACDWQPRADEAGLVVEWVLQ